MRLPNAAHILHSLEVARRGRAAAPERPSWSSQEAGPAAAARVAWLRLLLSHGFIRYLHFILGYARTYIFYCRSPLFYTFVLLLLERSLTPRGSSTCFLHAAGPLSTSASRVGEREAS